MKNILFFLPFLFIEDVFGKTNEMVTVVKGDSVTLHTGLTEIASDDVLDWSFGETRDLIARLNKATKNITIYNVLDGRFSGRLKVDSQTGDLTIRNIKTTDTGIYEVESTYNKAKGFNVSVVDADELKPMSLTETDFVTLNTDVPDIQKYDEIQWRFGSQKSPVAKLNRTKNVSYDGNDGKFKDRLVLDKQTGSLTIKNIKTTHTGLYVVDISSSGIYTIHKAFTLTVRDKMKSVIVKEQDLLTLNTDLTEVHKDDVIQWRHGDTCVAETNKAVQQLSKCGDAAGFGDRLKLNQQTGSLTITDIRATDSGLYKLDISNSRFTINKRFTVDVTATGVSPGVVAGIVVGAVVVGVVVASVAAAVMFFFYRRKISELEKIVPVEQGGSVTLEPDAEIGDNIQWMFGDKDLLIAEIKGNDRKTNRYYDPGEIFKGRQELDNKTGSLTIRNFRIEHAGDYKLKIRGRFIWASYKTFSVKVIDKYVTVIDGEYVILNTGLTEIQENNQILWYYGDHDLPIAKIKGGTEETPTYDDGPGGQFKDKLKLNEKTGDLIITNSIIEHDRLYKLQISTDNGTTSKRFWVTVIEKPVSLYEGKSVILYTGLPEIQENNQILWYCEDHYLPIAVIRGGTGESPTYNDGPDGKFKYKLKLDEKTGDLTITNTTAEHGGYYKLQIRTDNGTTSKRFWVYVVVMSVTVIDGNSVTLKTGLPEIQKYNQILWVFNFNSTIAEISGQTGETHTNDDGPGKIFKDKLKLDDKTGDLTITNTTDEHDGVYELRIRTDNGTISKRVRVYVEAASVTVIEGDSATLKTGLTEIQKNNQILWYCGDHDIPIAVIRGGTGERPTYNDGPDGKFKNKLKLNEKTGDLTITNTTAEHYGYYKLQIRTDNGTTSKGLRVIVKAKPVAVIEGDSVTLKTDLTELRKNNQILWMFRDSPIAEIKGGTEENPTYDDGPGGRFKNRLTLDKKTGDLTITNTTAKHDGVYKLQIRTDNGITSKRFRVYVKVESVPVIEGKSSTLNTGLPEIQISTDKGATSKRFNAFAEGKEVNDTYVNMPLLEDPDGANEQEAMSSL